MTNAEIARFEQETGWKYEDAVNEMFDHQREQRLFGPDAQPIEVDEADDRGDETWDFEVPITADGRIDKRQLRELRLFGCVAA